jgi:hypothetical protein
MIFICSVYYAGGFVLLNLWIFNPEPFACMLLMSYLFNPVFALMY